MRSRGFTLIELMITIALFGLLLFVGVPLTQSWTNSSYQRDAAGLLKQGISRAKATALRNQGAVQDTAPAAVLCHSGQNLKLFRLNAGQSAGLDQHDPGRRRNQGRRYRHDLRGLQQPWPGGQRQPVHHRHAAGHRR